MKRADVQVAIVNRRKYKAQKERERRMRIKLNEDMDSTKKS